jgi:hypothetical protein
MCHDLLAEKLHSGGGNGRFLSPKTRVTHLSVRSFVNKQ